jgi:hypothetical protein
MASARVITIIRGIAMFHPAIASFALHAQPPHRRPAAIA